MKTRIFKGLILTLIVFLALGLMGCEEEILIGQLPIDINIDQASIEQALVERALAVQTSAGNSSEVESAAGQSTAGIPKEILYIGGYNVIIAFDPLKLETIAEIPAPGPVRDMIFTKDGHLLYANHQDRQAISVVDTATQKIVDKITFDNSQGIRAAIFGMTLSADEKKMYVHLIRSQLLRDEFKTLTPQIVEVDLETKEITRTYEAPNATATLWSLENGQELVIVAQDIYKLNLKSGELSVMINLSNPERPSDVFMLWSRTNESKGKVPFFAYTYLPEEDDVILEAYILNLATGEFDAVNLGAPYGYFVGVYSEEQDRIYGVMNDLGIYQKSTGETIYHQPTKKGTYYSVNLSPDGKRIFLSGGGNDLIILDSATFEEIYSTEFSSDSVDARYVVRK